MDIDLNEIANRLIVNGNTDATSSTKKRLFGRVWVQVIDMFESLDLLQLDLGLFY